VLVLAFFLSPSGVRHIRIQARIFLHAFFSPHETFIGSLQPFFPVFGWLLPLLGGSAQAGGSGHGADRSPLRSFQDTFLEAFSPFLPNRYAPKLTWHKDVLVAAPLFPVDLSASLVWCDCDPLFHPRPSPALDLILAPRASLKFCTATAYLVPVSPPFFVPRFEPVGVILRKSPPTRSAFSSDASLLWKSTYYRGCCLALPLILSLCGIPSLMQFLLQQLPRDPTAWGPGTIFPFIPLPPTETPLLRLYCAFLIVLSFDTVGFEFSEVLSPLSISTSRGGP